MSMNDFVTAPRSVKERFALFLRDSKLTDCSFRVGERNVEVFKGHKLVFAVSSPVFEALFYGPLANNNPDLVIDVPDIEPNIFKLFMKYIYSDYFELSTLEEAQALMYTARKYLVFHLELLCTNFLMKEACLKTLWEVLPLAELFNSKPLVNYCIMIMSQHSYDFWKSDEHHFSGNTLALLLGKREMNMVESDLWRLALDWARKECKANGEEEKATNFRSALEKCGALSKLRFLTMNSTEWNIVKESGLLTSEEVDAITSAKPTPLFSEITEPRKRLPCCIWQYTRDFTFKNQLWIYSGEVISHITCSSRVLVTGFEVFTRICTITEYMKQISEYTYREKFVLSIKNTEGEILNKTEHDHEVVFNKTQTVHMSQPVWFEPNTKYTVRIGILTGQYPVTSFTKGSSCYRTSRFNTTFVFEDVVYIDEATTVPCGGFIVSIFYTF